MKLSRLLKIATAAAVGALVLTFITPVAPASAAPIIPPTASKVDSYDGAAYADGWRWFLACEGQAPKLKEMCVGTRMSMNWKQFVRETGDQAAVDGSLIQGSMASPQGYFYRNIEESGAWAVVYPFIYNYSNEARTYLDLKIRQFTRPGEVIAKPTFTCDATCESKVYVRFVPIGKFYNADGELLGDAGENPVNDGQVDFGSAENGTDEGGPTGETTGLLKPPNCLFSTFGPDGSCDTGRPSSITECININPADFKFDVPCIFAFLFLPTTQQVDAMMGTFDLLFEERQPFLFFFQAGESVAYVFGAAATGASCVPQVLTVEMSFAKFSEFSATLFPCSAELQAIIRPVTTWVAWLMVVGAVGTWVFRKVEPSFNAHGGE